MANPTRFVSVNLNKSYGKQPARSSSSSSPAPLPYANGGIGSRGRFAGTGGRGMVVLSRARGAAPSGQKAGAKLSVPAPLNLPSLRKEHERFDPAAASGSTPGPGASALGSGHSSSAMGWSKPATADGARDPTGIGEREPPYATQRAASAGTGMVSGASERAVLLRGEDFPSLKATFLVGQKQKDAAGQKQRIAVQQQQQQQSEERAERPSSEPTLTMRPHVRNPRYADFKESNDEESATGEKGSEEKLQKLDGFLSGPIPLIQFKHTSDWADDERDTSHGIPDKGRVRGFSRVESGKGYDYLDMGGALERDFGRVDSFDRDVHTPGRSANSWRSPLHSREGFNTRESGLDRDGHGLRFSNHNRDVNKDSVKYGHSMYGDSSSEGPRSGHAEQHHSWRSLGHGQNLQTARINVVMLDARHTEQGEHDLQFDASSNRYKGGPFLKNNSSKQLSTRGISSDDPVLKFGRDNRNNSSNGKVSLENLATESRDLFSGGMSVDANSKISRRKKDTSKQVDFYDPVRESFEAELERVQKFQEEERQRALQEHARVLELARKEEEERERRVREEEERRRRHEEEAREAAWRAEQERLATAKRAEEQRLAREEEKKSILAEEERRKEAARQKLLELEAKIAKRQAEDASKDNQLPVRSAEHQVSEMKESDDVKVPGNDYWEEGERVVQHVTNSAVSEPAVSTRFIVPGPNFPLSMEGNPPLIEKGKLMNSWKNEAYDHVNNSSVFLQQENELQITKQDAFGSGRVLPRKGFLGGQGPSHLRPSSRSAVLDSTHSVGDYHLPKGQHWTNSSQGDRYNRNAFIDHDLESGKYDLGWDQSPLRGSSQVIYAQNISPRSESDGYSNPLRSRYSLRQPRVFPPPSITSVRRCSLKDGPEQPSLSVFERENMNRTAGSRHENQAYESEDHHEESEYLDISSSKENACVLQNDKDASRCGSQSSLSVSNPPTSPTHLSHDDFVDSADFPSLPASADGRPVTFSDGEHAMARPELDKANLTMASSSLPSGEEEWSIGNNGEMLDQEEYDEDEIYHEEVDHHEGDENTIHIGEDFDLSTELQNLGVEMEHDQKVLGFNDGVEVIIPNDDFDETSVDTRKNVDVEVAPKDATLRLGSSDGAISNGDDLDLEIAFPVEVGSTTILLNDTEKAFHGLVLEPATSTTTSFAMKNSELSPVTSDQTYATSAFDLPELSSTPGRPAPSSASTVHDQVEAPTKLHFDLFSGPSLIQSPIPAIQIGSIQMPLNINSPIGPPHVHPPQPPFFQFGQLRYSSPVSQGILPISSQSIPYTPSPVPLVHFSSHQNFARSYSNTGILSVSTQNVSSMSVPNKPNYGKKYTEDPNKPEFSQSSALHANQHKVALSSQDLAECFPSQGNQITSELDTSMKIPENPVNVSKGYSISMDEKNHPPVEPQTGNKSSQFLNGDKSFHRSRTSGSIMAGRGKKYIYTVKNRGPRQQFSGLDIPRVEFGIDRRIRRNIRRTEFRVRENNYKRFDNSDASIYIGQDDKPSSSGSSFVPSSKHASKRDITYSKLSRLTIEPESLNIAYRNVQTALFDGRKKSGKESLTNMSTPSMINSQFEDRNFKRSATIEEDVDAPLQSGVVRIFKQPGIEAPSDEDDFIEVRSKRQMLHDRREQREKEIKAKSREAKAPRKTRPVYQANSVSSKLGKVVNGDISKSVSASFPIELAGFPSGGQSTAFSVNTVSQPLAPVGTPTVIADNDVRPLIKKSGGASTVMVNSSGVKTDLLAKSCLERVIPFENATPLTSWSDVHMNQQVIMDSEPTHVEEHVLFTPPGSTDPGWKYAYLMEKTDPNSVTCRLCGKVLKGGINRMKQHLGHIKGNCKACPKANDEVQKEIRDYIEGIVKKKNEKAVTLKEMREEVAIRATGSSTTPCDGTCLGKRPRSSDDDIASMPMRQSVIKETLAKEERARVNKYVAKFFYDCDIPFNMATKSSFIRMCEAIGQYGSGYKSPSYYEIAEPLLKDEVEETKEFLKSHKDAWKKSGCSIMTDAWTDMRGRSIMNLCVNSSLGTCFLKSVDASADAHTAEYISALVEDCIKEVGVDNVLQVVTDNASANMAAGRLLKTKYPKIFWSSCAAHCLDLILEEFGKEPKVKNCIAKARTLTIFIYSHAKTLSLMRHFTQKGEIVRPGQTRFATCFLTLQSVFEKKEKLRLMFSSDEWRQCKWSKTRKCEVVGSIVLSTSFWSQVSLTLKVFSPLVRLLRIVDGDRRPSLSFVYGGLEDAKKEIKSLFKDNEHSYKPCIDAIDSKSKGRLDSSLHLAAYYLNPYYFYKDDKAISEDSFVIGGFLYCLEIFYPDLDVQDVITTKEMVLYKNGDGPFGKPLAIKQRSVEDAFDPANWWSLYGGETPYMKAMALKILKLTSSSSGCERNWSSFAAVMALTQKQLEEAMNPERFDTSGALVAEHGAMAKDQEKSSSIANQDKSFSTSGSPLSSLLAGERIQFGAVTTPSFIPSVSRAIPNGFGCHALASCKTESFRERLTTSEIDHTLFFDEGKHHADSCVHLEDSEAEAEAAASAVAVAAISSDEVVNNDLNVTSGSISDSEKFGNADACGLTSQGVRSNGEVRNISIGEESLPVTLPADLSVETPVPLWPALPNPQSTSSTMFSQFPGPPPSQFPCFEMNPMLRGPIFTFSPQNESGSTQPQPQRSTALGPGPLGAWSHSGMDSFYGPPAGFAGHFISPPAGMPAVQAPPQMVFYNHFPTLAPFGVGIMGTTFISSGKQPDWKHNPTSSATSINEGDNGNLATCSPQLIPPSMPPSLQHLSPASPLVPMASHLPMFDLSPFQSTVDVPVQARWSHMPPAPLHGMPFSPLPRTQVDGGMPLDMGQKIANLPPGSNKFPETRSATAEADAKFTFSTDSAAHFPDELGLLDCPVSVASHASGSGPSYSTLRGNTSDDKGPNVGKNFARSSGGSSRASIGIVSGSNSASSNGINHGSISTSKPQIAPQQSTTITHQPHHPVGYSDKRGASSSQKMASGGDWLRRAGFQGRSHAPSGSERNFPSSKMKQIYVAKSPATGAPNTG